MSVGSQIRRIAALNVPVEAMREMFIVLAEQLEQEEARKSEVAARQSRYRSRHSNKDNDVTVTQQSRDSDVTVALLAPVLDNITSTSKQEESKEKDNLTVIQKAASSKPLPSEPEAFGVFWDKYPKRAGNANRKGALKAFNAARKRVDLQDLFDGADAYRVHCEESEIIKTQFVQQARTWLNADGWTETYESKPNGQYPKLSSVDRAEAELLADIDEHWRRKDEAEAIDVHGDDIAPNVSRLRQND